jgi:UDP-N-acetylmuramate dehydrogenase
VHANFFVNLGNAKARNVLDLIELVRTRAREVRGVELETEVEIVGED